MHKRAGGMPGGFGGGGGFGGFRDPNEIFSKFFGSSDLGDSMCNPLLILNEKTACGTHVFDLLKELAVALFSDHGTTVLNYA